MSSVRLDKAAGERFVSVPSDLVARIDAFAVRTHTSRAKATRFLLQAALAGVGGKGFSPTLAARALEKIAPGASSSPSESATPNGGGAKARPRRAARGRLP